MSHDRTLPATLADAVWPAAGTVPSLARAAALALLGSVLLTVSAKVQVPFWPVPMTLQTMMVLLLGVAYGPRLALATVLLYLAEGAAGMPVFVGTPERGIGLAYMAGPTGGYLVGFALAAVVAGLTAERSRSMLATALGLLAATVATYLCGVAWLATIVGSEKVVALGVTPFLLGEIVKLALATTLAEAGLARLRRRAVAER
jgi:biotin transport system substrate-specific component